MDLAKPLTQAAFGDLIGVSQQAVSDLVTRGVLNHGAPAGEWLAAYCDRLREQAAGRIGADAGGLDLVQERAALAREQRIAQAMKNAVARGEYAPIGLLADVLAAASAGVVDRFEQLDGALKKACPDLPESARNVVRTVIASARNEWARSTAELVVHHLDATTVEAASDDDDPFLLGALGDDAG
ncbi:MAG: hypothetical protein HY856_10725 [Burkholderiales bacterium]|nr:hypothetical protein [Burkholderiales bacterium]